MNKDKNVFLKTIKKQNKYLFLKKLEDSQINNFMISSIFNQLKLKKQNKEELEKFIVDGRLDSGIDVISIVDELENSKTAYFIQHTFNNNNINSKIISTLTKMKNYIKNFNSEEYENISKNSKLFKLINEIKNDKNIKNFKYVFIYDGKIKDIQKSTLDFVKENEFIFIDRDKFNFYKIKWFIQNLPVEDIKKIKPIVQIHYSDFKKEKINSKDSIQVALINSKFLIKPYEKYGKELFGSNIRYFLGTLNSINKSICKTIEEDEDYENFPKFNNGITIICEKIEKNENQEYFKLFNSQIINGAQTTFTLCKMEKEILNKIFILVKIIIQNNNKKITNKISKYSNSQNNIKIRDLYSNSLEQIKLQKYFFKNNILLEIKREEFTKNIFLKNFTILKNEVLGQIFVSTILNQPWNSKNQKSKIFKDENLYEQIFKNNKYSFDNYFNLYLIWKKIKDFYENNKKIETYYKIFNFILLNIIFDRIQKIKKFINININEIENILKNIKNKKLLQISSSLVTFLRKNDKKENGEDKDIRDISISKKMKILLPIFYKQINWK